MRPFKYLEALYNIILTVLKKKINKGLIMESGFSKFSTIFIQQLNYVWKKSIGDDFM